MINASDSTRKPDLYSPLVVPVWKRYGFDSAPGEPLESICAGQSLDADFLMEILRLFEGESLPDAEILGAFPLETLLDYLQRTHIYYLESRLPEIEQVTAAMLRNPDYAHPAAHILADLLIEIKTLLAGHIYEEEMHLFPYIRHLISAEKTKQRAVCHVISQEYSIRQFAEGHDDEAEQKLAQFARLISKIEDNSRNLSHFRVFRAQIEGFLHDLTIHAFIEDEVLTAKARILEISLLEN